MLHPFERKVLPLISGSTRLSEIKTGLKDVEVMRALEWLENKGLIKTEKTVQKLIILDYNGQMYKKKGLPERRVLSELKDESLSLNAVKKAAQLDSEELNAAIGALRRVHAITINKDKEGILIQITEQGKALLKKITSEENLIAGNFPQSFENVNEEMRHAVTQLQKRNGILSIKEEKDRVISLTDAGKAVLAHGIGKEDLIGRITPSMIQASYWKNKQFRAYDVAINVPRFYPGKKHMVTQAVEYIKRIWLELGFKEMDGRMIETAFWDLDALFVPQDHPARDMQDTFYIAEPSTADLPAEAKKIKAVHENGGKTGSKGWGSSWSAEEAKKLLLRTHMTVLSARTLSRLKTSELPAKFFAVGKVFRNEALDWKHLFEFYQVDGIVIDPNANMKHLKGYLKEFYRKMGYDKVRIRPAHFPYTEPSCEVEVFHPVKKEWVELGGAGIFRPELVIPLLGKDIPVLAWGLGLDRIITAYYNITDIRDLYKNDISMLREAKLWVR